MKPTAEHIRNFLNEHNQYITHWAVAHTPFHTYKATPQQLERMKNEAQKQCLFFRRSFSQFLYQAKALRKPEIYSPLPPPPSPKNAVPPSTQKQKTAVGAQQPPTNSATLPQPITQPTQLTALQNPIAAVQPAAPTASAEPQPMPSNPLKPSKKLGFSARNTAVTKKS